MSAPHDRSPAATAERVRALELSATIRSGPFASLAAYRLCPICLTEGGIPRYSALDKGLRSALIDIDGLPTEFLDSFPMIYAHCETCDHLFISPTAPLERIDLCRIAPARREQMLRVLNDRSPNLWMEDSRYIDEKRWSIAVHYEISGFESLDHGLPILDIGCGTGVGLSVFHERGWTRCYGLEPDVYSVRQIEQQRPFINALWADIYSPETTLFTDFFGLIMLDNVLEHHTEPHLSIDICARMLAKGGRLWISVPNAQGPALATQGAAYRNMNFGHWSFFSPRSLALLLARQFDSAMMYDSFRRCDIDLRDLSKHAEELASFTSDWVQAVAILPERGPAR